MAGRKQAIGHSYWMVMKNHSKTMVSVLGLMSGWGVRRMDSTTSTPSAAGDRAPDEEANLVGDYLAGHSSRNRHKMRILSCWL